MKSKYSNRLTVGEKFGKYIVCDSTIVPSQKGYAKIKVKCSCGVENLVDIYGLIKGRTKSCITCSGRETKDNPAWKGYQEIYGSFFNRIKRQAKERDIPFNITIEQVWEQYLKQDRKCALTGLSLTFQENASIDRVDSNQGYCADNIQIVHKDINLMKNHFDENYFIEMCK